MPRPRYFATLLGIGASLLLAWRGDPLPAAPSAPNIILILADDIGYGDLQCYNDQSKIPTPHLDRLAEQGMRFTDAHSPSTVCTPTRYSMMTGRMCFRTGYRGVFVGVGGPALIEAERLTLPQMLRRQGYKTACVGKWHIGMTFLTADGTPAHETGAGLEGVRQVDWSKPIPDGPVHRGFDYFFGTACCPTTDWLYAYIEQDRVPVPPAKPLDRATLPKHPYSRDCRGGLIAPNFDMERVDLEFLKRSQEWLKQHVQDKPEQPFFLFHSMQAVHLPSFAAPEFQGKSDSGPHGDFIFQMDHIVGELMKTLDELGVAKETLVVFTSDNGPEVTTTVQMRRDHQHDPARPWRGMKRDNWEGGHRVPLIVRWPGNVEPGTVSTQLISLTDLMATCGAIVGGELPENAAEDSFNMLPVLAGTQGVEPVRPYLLQQTISLALSIRAGRWKLLDHRGSGGNHYVGDELREFALPDTAPDAPGQLYDLQADPGETRNLYDKHPEVVARLRALLEASKASGRSRE